MHKALKPKLKLWGILARERRQTEDSQYYEEHEGCLYKSEVADWR